MRRSRRTKGTILLLLLVLMVKTILFITGFPPSPLSPPGAGTRETARMTGLGRRRGQLGRRESRGTKTTTLAFPLHINRGWWIVYRAFVTGLTCVGVKPDSAVSPRHLRHQRVWIPAFFCASRHMVYTLYRRHGLHFFSIWETSNALERESADG